MTSCTALFANPSGVPRRIYFEKCGTYSVGHRYAEHGYSNYIGLSARRVGKFGTSVIGMFALICICNINFPNTSGRLARTEKNESLRYNRLISSLRS